MAKRTMVRGTPYLVGDYADEGVEDGALLFDVRNRSAWRALCRDGEEVVLRNMRTPGAVEAVPPASVAVFYRRLEPAP